MYGMKRKYKGRKNVRVRAGKVIRIWAEINIYGSTTSGLHFPLYSKNMYYMYVWWTLIK